VSQIKEMNGINMMKQKIVNFTHYDLDGVVCYILLKHLFSIERYYSCGYGKVDQKIDEIDLNAMNVPLYVTDLSLNNEQYRKLDQIYEKIIYIDHHESSLIELKEFQIHGLINIERCACALIFYLYKKEFEKLDCYENLKKLVQYTDTYDRWKIHEKEFKIGYGLNELFWHYQFKDFAYIFKNGFDNFAKVEIEIIKKNANEKKSILESAKRFVFDNEALVLILSDAENVINDATLLYNQYKIHFVISSGLRKISIRHTLDKNIAIVMDEIFKDDETIETYGGHKSAGSFIYKEFDLKKLKEDLSKIKEKLLC
jgi:oligoribonuclease NrnB/cAMP/cGMP phosphodiesterase (DHH superfamily)